MTKAEIQSQDVPVRDGWGEIEDGETDFNPFKPRKEIPQDLPQFRRQIEEKMQDLMQSDAEI